jgi:hypothetical protein
MLRMSNHIHGITHVIVGIVDVCWTITQIKIQIKTQVDNGTCVYYYTT